MKKGVNEKKAQVTIFIILAVMLVTAGGIAFVITKNSSSNGIDNDFFSQQDVKQGVNQIQSSVLDCATLTGQDALDLIGIQGGYYNAPKDYYDLGWAFLPYYYKEGQLLMPEKSRIESELGTYVDDNLNSCLDGVSVEGFDLSYSKSKTKATITNGKVNFEIDLPLTIKKENKRTIFQLKDSPVSVNSKLYEMIEIGKYITDSHEEDASMICINCVANMAEERELYVDMIDFSEEGDTLIVISANVTDTYPLTFEFLNKYPPK